MNYCVLMGSPRKNGNTKALLAPFLERLQQEGNKIIQVWLYDKHILPCTACRRCQSDWSRAYCVQKDDFGQIIQEIEKCDRIVLASPIYSWYCTPPLKSVLDRLVYAFNKYYGDEKGPSLWEGKGVVIVTTCGYRPEKGADLFEEGIKRYCKHSKLNYLGMLAARDYGYHQTFMDEQKEVSAYEFAEKLLEQE